MGLSIRLYNSIPQCVLNLSLQKFKVTIKITLIRKAHYTVQKYLKDKNVFK